MDDDPHDLVVRTIREHASALLRTARKHSLCADDAHDAYQRALEIFLRRAATIEPETASRWLHVVIKHEALAIRRARGRLVPPEEVDLDARAAASAPDADERVLRFDRLARSAEALARLKPQEVRALWLKAQGHSYAEIAASEGWSYTKVNRCLTEGRRSFLDRYASIEAGEECRRWAPVVSAMVDGEATADQLAAARPHLRRCAGCRATLRELQAAGPRLAGVLPAGVVGAAAAAAASAPVAVRPGLAETLLRAVETAAVSAHERATAWAVRAQLAADALSAGKVAAVAASAVAVAGGGAVTVSEVRDREPRGVAAAGREAPPPAHAAAAAPAAAHRPSPTRRPATIARARSAATGPSRRPAGPARGSAPVARTSDRAVEFSPERRPRRAAPAGEFAPDPHTAAVAGGAAVERKAPAGAAPDPTARIAATTPPAAALVERGAAPRAAAPTEFAPEG